MNSPSVHAGPRRGRRSRLDRNQPRTSPQSVLLIEGLAADAIAPLLLRDPEQTTRVECPHIAAVVPLDLDPLGQCSDDKGRGRERVAIQGAFPHQDHLPTQRLERSGRFSIAGDIALELFLPKGRIGSRQGRPFAVRVTMPETAVHKDDGSIFGQDEIRSAGQAAAPQTIPKAQPVQRGAQDPLRLGVSTDDPGHQPRALRRGQDIGHRDAQASDRIAPARSDSSSTSDSIDVIVSASTAGLFRYP
jgi:hypothetical protein